MKKINIALIGAGYISDYHARGLLTMPQVALVAVVSKHLGNAEKFASKYGIKNAYSSITPVVEDPTIDAVIISTPNSFHAPYAIEFLKNGKDVFLEKPMAMNAGEGEQIAQVADEKDRLVMVGHMWRFDTDTQFIKDSIDAGKLGKVFKTKGYGIHENWGPTGWFTQKKLAGGGALADMGVHAIDTIRYLLGDPKPVQVYAKIATNFGDYDVDDSGIIVITWDNGTESIIESGWWHPHMDGPEASSGVFGTEGYASLFPTFLKLKKGEESSEEIVPTLPKRDEHCDQIIYTRQMQYFIDCIKTRKHPIPGLNEGQVVLRIVDAAYESAKKQTVINL
ncbi:Gfo/Idh/MocA family oxidoreductase [Maribacter polysiphoniae]|uniref:Gfo/Idh/MocA family oxidoreductase n=1 Tax=Maribacter polysiphoniae TaxID=429344 RepID=A0A316E2C3_9FLAO|nr:Gfo/Idh/MocA family oxidoreductase [Maribacter polysiphoniae]MBD1260971.1 Gfo/Idh/MocA family oxidoreductase [Maribacter polysiphoniae]PWK23788.1 putative dehydrogenase [Maribacter polysiphoniae]